MFGALATASALLAVWLAPSHLGVLGDLFSHGGEGSEARQLSAGLQQDLCPLPSRFMEELPLLYRAHLGSPNSAENTAGTERAKRPKNVRHRKISKVLWMRRKHLGPEKQKCPSNRKEPLLPHLPFTTSLSAPGRKEKLLPAHGSVKALPPVRWHLYNRSDSEGIGSKWIYHFFPSISLFQAGHPPVLSKPTMFRSPEITALPMLLVSHSGLSARYCTAQLGSKQAATPSQTSPDLQDPALPCPGCPPAAR